MAEFVDNSIQSYLDSRDRILEYEGSGYALKVDISSDGGSIVVRDNAGGIAESEYERAFRPAAVPPDQSGLSEFGMGMKSAACWFADRWSVRTSAVGERVERTVKFDVDRIVHDNLEELSISSRPAVLSDHYTEISLNDLHRIPRGRTVGKIKSHLASIYREFIRSGLLVLTFDGDALAFPEPKILRAPYFRDASGQSVEWRKDIEFDFGGGLGARGFAALLETGSVSGAGFSLFRRSRVIEGSGDDGYRPEYIFKKSNSYTYQRLFGELHLTGFEVSHTKDGFRWEENEDVFLELLREHLDAQPLPLIAQAEGHRKRPSKDELKKAAESANQRIANTLEETLPQVLDKVLDDPPDTHPIPPKLPNQELTSVRIVEIYVNEIKWRIAVELSNDPAIGAWIERYDQLVEGFAKGNDIRNLGIRLSLAHPFMQRFAGTDDEKIEIALRMGIAVVLAEIIARSSGVRLAGTFRRNINNLLRDSLSRL